MILFTQPFGSELLVLPLDLFTLWALLTTSRYNWVCLFCQENVIHISSRPLVLWFTFCFRLGSKLSNSIMIERTFLLPCVSYSSHMVQCFIILAHTPMRRMLLLSVSAIPFMSYYTLFFCSSFIRGWGCLHPVCCCSQFLGFDSSKIFSVSSFWLHLFCQYFLLMSMISFWLVLFGVFLGVSL